VNVFSGTWSSRLSGIKAVTVFVVQFTLTTVISLVCN